MAGSSSGSRLCVDRSVPERRLARLARCGRRASDQNTARVSRLHEVEEMEGEGGVLDLDAASSVEVFGFQPIVTRDPERPRQPNVCILHSNADLRRGESAHLGAQADSAVARGEDHACFKVRALARVQARSWAARWRGGRAAPAPRRGPHALRGVAPRRARRQPKPKPMRAGAFQHAGGRHHGVRGQRLPHLAALALPDGAEPGQRHRQHLCAHLVHGAQARHRRAAAARVALVLLQPRRQGLPGVWAPVDIMVHSGLLSVGGTAWLDQHPWFQAATRVPSDWA